MHNKAFSPIEWMIKNHIPVNFLMLFLLIGGYFSYKSIKKEVFPLLTYNTVTISVSYPGAQPSEIERSIIKPIEAEIQSLDGIKKIVSTARANRGTVIVELSDFINTQEVYLDIKNVVDSITTFPSQARRPNVTISKKRALAASLVLYGNQPYDILYNNAQKIKNDLINEDNISLVQLDNLPNKEISIEVSQENLLKYNLSLNEISRKIRQNSRELSAGIIKSKSGEILVKTNELKEYATEFENTAILTSDNGNTLYLKDIATIRESYAKDVVEYYYNGLPAFRVSVYTIGKESPIKVIDSVRKYIKKAKETYDNKINIDILEDKSRSYRERLDLLTRNAVSGLLLVLLILGLFLEIRLAFWVMLGVPISILGSFIILKGAGGSLNLISMFAFIVTLGIVVDDAVIIGEAVYDKRQQGHSFINSAIWGTKEMLMPVTFAVLTNIIAFCPLLFVPGVIGDIFFHIPLVVLSVFFISLVESLFILPSHLAHKPTDNRFWKFVNRPQKSFNKWFNKFRETTFRSVITLAIKNRYITFTLAIAILILSISLLKSDYLPFHFLPQISKDTVQARVRLTDDSTIEQSRQAAKILAKSALDTSKSFPNSQPIKGIFSEVKPNGSVVLTTYLTESDNRFYSGTQFSSDWQLYTPTKDIAKLKSISFTGRVGFGRASSSDLSISIIHPNLEIQQHITKEVTKQLANLKGITKANNTLDKGKQEFSLKLKPQAHLLNMTGDSLAQQLRSLIYGDEALRFQRGENEVLVFVRLPEEERISKQALNDFVIKTPSGSFSKLKYLATVEEKTTNIRINRSQRKNILTINANINRKKNTLSKVISNLKEDILPKIKAKYPSFNYIFEGENEERDSSLSFLPLAFIFAFGVIFALLSMALNSYVQPFIVMLSIPFGIIGAIIGHILLGYSLSISSIIGIIGLSGVVINDALVFIVTFNRLREQGKAIAEVALEACIRRLRPIILTSVTTFFGLLPMLFESSLQAKFLIPMGISISFGIISATLITLIFIPCTCVIFSDLGLIKKKDIEEEVK